jgi:hypothetical protein
MEWYVIGKDEIGFLASVRRRSHGIGIQVVKSIKNFKTLHVGDRAAFVGDAMPMLQLVT